MLTCHVCRRRSRMRRARVTVIDAEMIRRSGYRDLGRLLRLVPGMQVAGTRWASDHQLPWPDNRISGTRCKCWSMAVRSTRRISMVARTGPASPLALEEIERIEVVRGSDSAAYGSNAFLGVVNIITRHSAVAPAAWSRVNLGSGAVRDLAAGASLRRQGASPRGDIQYRNDSGFDGIGDDREQVLRTCAGCRVQRDGRIFLFAGLVDSRLGMGYANSRFNGNGVREATSDDAYLHLRWRYAPSEHEEWLINVISESGEQGRDEWIVSGSAGVTTYTVPVNQNRISLRDDP